MPTATSHASSLADVGWQVIADVFTAAECRQMIADWEASLDACADDAAALRRASGALYGARNVLSVYPAVASWWRRPSLLSLLHETLGAECGLVRALYFDKPPTATWSLPWHRDLTIAVQDHRLPTHTFQNPTTKAGVPHVEAPRALLDRMLTLRIHLDAATADNGPLQVLSGSHRDEHDDVGPLAGRTIATILTNAGDVLAMRPRLLHCSGVSQPGCLLHRRVLHLEFAADAHLPDGYRWHTFLRTDN